MSVAQASVSGSQDLIGIGIMPIPEMNDIRMFGPYLL